MKTDEKGFLFFYSWVDPFSRLSGDEFKRVFLAMLEYQRYGTPPPKMEGASEIISDFLVAAIDTRKEISERLRGNIQKRWNRNTDHCNTTVIQDDTTVIQDDTIVGKRIEENRIDKNRIEEVIKETTKENPLAERFAVFWSKYPKKVGKEAARKAFLKIRPNDELFGKMVDGIDKAKKSQQWQEEHGRYIPNPATWLNQGRWDDELTAASVSGGSNTAKYNDFDADEALDRALKRSLEKYKQLGGK